MQENSKVIGIKLNECAGAYVAQYKFTVLLMPNGPHKITGVAYSSIVKNLFTLLLL